MEWECVSIVENKDQKPVSLTVQLKSTDKIFPDSFCTITSDMIFETFGVGAKYTISILPGKG